MALAKQSENNKKIAGFYLKRHERMQSHRRTNWESNWESIAEFIMPRKDEVFGHRAKGERKYNKLFDSTSIHSNEILASSLSGMLVPSTQRWLAFSTGDPELDKDPEVRDWMQEVAEKMLAEFNASNFYTEMHETFLDLGSIGTSTVFTGEDKEGGNILYFKSQPIYGFWIAVDRFKRVSVMSWEEEKTFRELAEEYGEDNLPPDVLEEARHNELREFTVVRFIEPNKNFLPDKPKVPTNKPINSVHVLKKNQFLLKVSGFDEMPYSVPRWTVANNEVYGRSPGMKAMPDIKMVNAMSKVIIRGAQKTIDPPLQAPDNGFLLPLDTTPGGVNFYRQGMQDRIEPLITGSRPDIGLDMIEAYRQQIRQAFFIDQLQLRDGPQMTATEVRQRTEEQLRLLGPILARFNSELLRPTVERAFGIMLRRGQFSDPPEALRGRELQTEFISQIAKAQKASQADTLLRVVDSIAPIAQSQPEVMDNFDPDQVLREHANIFGLSEKMLKKPDEVKELREERADRQRQQELVEQQRQQAETLQRVGQAGQQQ